MPYRTAGRTQFLADVLITAVEGGVNGWAAVSHYRHPDPAAWPGTDPRAVVHVLDDNGSLSSERHEVTIDTVSRGVGRIWAGDVAVSRDVRHAVMQGDRWNDAGLIDAGAADAIVQAGLFGELVYG